MMNFGRGLFREVLRRLLAVAVVVAVIGGCAAYVIGYHRFFDNVARQVEHMNNCKGHVLPDFEVVDREGRQGSMLQHLRQSSLPLIAVALIKPGCPRCDDLVDRLERARHRFPDRFGVLLVDVTGPSTHQATTNTTGPKPGLQDANGAFQRVFSGTVTPMLFLVRSDGEVADAWVGLPKAGVLESRCQSIIDGEGL